MGVQKPVIALELHTVQPVFGNHLAGLQLQRLVGDVVDHLVKGVVKYKALGNRFVVGWHGHGMFLRFGVLLGHGGYAKSVSRLHVDGTTKGQKKSKDE